MRRAAFSTPCGVARSPRAGSGEQLRVRHAVPERIGKPARRHVWLPLRIRGLVQPEEEVGRLQHRLDHELRALQEILFGLQERFVPLLLARFQRPAEGFQSELAHETRAAGGRWLARDQPVRVAAAKRVARQSFGGRAVRFDQQRRKVLGLGLIPEAVDEILGRKLVRRARSGRPASRERCGCTGCASGAEGRSLRAGCPHSGILFFAILQCPVNSTPESCVNRWIHAFRIASSGLPGLIRSPPACANAVRRLIQQEGTFGMLAIDQVDERSSEGLDSLGSRVGLRKVQAGGGCDAVGVVAGAAGSLLHHLIQTRSQTAPPGHAKATKHMPRVVGRHASLRSLSDHLKAFLVYAQASMRHFPTD